MGVPRKTSRRKGAWAEEWCRDHLSMQPLTRTAPLRGAYLPDGQLGPYLVSVKSSEGKSLRLFLAEWREHVAAAAREGKEPLLVIVLDRRRPTVLVAGYPMHLLRLVTVEPEGGG